MTLDEQKLAELKETLNEHPERWAILMIYVFVVSEINQHGRNASELAVGIYGVIGVALSEFGFGSVGLNTARALLAARESEEAE
jgi:hypothetical protein